MNVITDLNVEENREIDNYSIIIYFVKPGDTLWKIAKKFRSTVENIVKINEIEDENTKKHLHSLNWLVADVFSYID